MRNSKPSDFRDQDDIPVLIGSPHTLKKYPAHWILEPHNDFSIRSYCDAKFFYTHTEKINQLVSDFYRLGPITPLMLLRTWLQFPVYHGDSKPNQMPPLELAAIYTFLMATYYEIPGIHIELDGFLNQMTRLEKKQIRGSHEKD